MNQLKQQGPIGPRPNKQPAEGPKVLQTEIRQLTPQLLAFQSVITAITSSQDLQSILDTVAREMARLLAVEGCAIATWDRTADKLSVLARYSPEAGRDGAVGDKIYHLVDYPFTKQVLVGPCARQMTISQPDIAPTELAYMQAAKMMSRLMVPMIFQDRVIGLVELVDTQSERAFTEHEVSVAQMLANQTAMAIGSARLYAETQRRALQQTVLHELDQAITTNLRLKDMYYVFARYATRVLHYDCMSINRLEGENIRITYVAGEDENGLPVGTTLPLNASAMGWVMEKGELLLRHNVAADIRFAEDESLVARGIRSSMIIPLRVKGEVIGTWNLNSRQAGAYNPDDLDIAQVMADQLAISIENARLYDEIRQYLEELTTLNTVSQAITSTLDWQETLAIITNHTIRLLGVAATSVVLYDEDKRDLWFAVTSGGGADSVRGMRLKVGQGIVGWVVEHGEALLVPDVSKDPRFSTQFDQVSGFTTQSILCVPLQTKGQTIGAIEALNKERAFNQEDLRLLISLAASAATAIENARLYKQAQQEIAERKRAEEALQKSLQQLETTYNQAMFYAQELKEEIAERKRVEAALEEERTLLAQRVAERTADLRMANEELARAARLKDEFLASMSHELRTPLSAILGLAEVLKGSAYGMLNERQLKAVGNIEESGRHLLALINDILDLSKIGAGKLELEMGQVSVAAVCQASLRLIKAAAHKKQIEVSSTLDDTVTMLQADERRLKQILVNLLSNAVKFTPEGGAVGLEVVGDAVRQEVHFTIWDTGIGISSEEMPRLFAPFVQLDSRLSRQYPGTGLGLALVQRMVELHHGRISVESEMGQGSRFTVSLPWVGVTRFAELVEPAKPTPSVEPAMPDIDRESSIVGELLATTSQLGDYLSASGVETVIQARGDEALVTARQVKPDVIILDIERPDLPVGTLLTQLKTDLRIQNIPVLIISEMGERLQELAPGMAGYLTRPTSGRNLQQALNQALSQRADEAPQTVLIVIPDYMTRKPVSSLPPIEQRLILLVEDDEKLAMLLADYLLTRGFRVTTVQNGIEAVEQTRVEKPDLILMDIQMPEMDGLEAIRRIRTDTTPGVATTPIIALTALAMSGDRERCLQAGANEYLSKPVKLKKLLQAIQAQLLMAER